MEISKQELRKLVVEEYFKEEAGISIALDEITDKQKDEFIAWVKGGPRPKWANDDLGKSGKPKSGQAPGSSNTDRSAQTMPIGMDVPSDDAPKEMSVNDIIDNIYGMISSYPAEDVKEIFQIVFERLPGVELSDPEPPGQPPTEYGGEELELRQKQGRRIGYEESKQLADLMGLIKEVMIESGFYSKDSRD